MTAPEILAHAEGADALVVFPGDPIDHALIGALPPRVRALLSYSAGLDHIDLAAAAERGLVVTNTPAAVTEATAEIAALLILAAARRTGEGERLLRAGRWPGWAPCFHLGQGVGGKRLGIVGMGNIGVAVAERMRAFGMSIFYFSRRPNARADEAGATRCATLIELANSSDVVSVHCPSTEETRGLMNAAFFAAMRTGALFINTARGDVVNDDALVAALADGRIGGAGLDVYAHEPDLDPRYLSFENVVLLPHLGTATIEAREQMGQQVLANLNALLAGDAPPNAIGVAR